MQFVGKTRFGDSLQVHIDVDIKLETIQIPRFILQPLIENAVKHGISKTEKNGTIELSIRLYKNHLEIVVSDNGPDFPDDLVSGHGLQSVYDLLRLSYKENASMNWENSPKKKITILIHSVK